MSHGAKWLYVALKRRKPNGRNRAFVSYRHAQRELKASPKKIREWFAELVHYGFIRLAVHASLGVDGKGKAPHWRLTECGQTSKTSAEGLFEPPTNDFLKWDGILFDPTPFRESVKWDENKLKKQNPASHVGSAPLPTSEAPPFPTSEALKCQSASHGVHIERNGSASHGVHITSLASTSAFRSKAPPSSNGPPEDTLEEENSGDIYVKFSERPTTSGKKRKSR